MTKTDKQSAWAALFLMAMVACVAYYRHRPNLAFTLGFPAIMFVLYAWMGRAFSANWRVRHDADSFVFHKPLVFRTMGMLFVLLLAGIAVVTYRSPAAGAEAHYFITAFFGAVCIPFLSMAEPSRFVFNLSQQEYTWTRGFWPFVRTSRGGTAGGTVRLVIGQKGSRCIRFRPATKNKYGLFVAFCSPEQADAQAYQLADALGVLVERKT